VTASASKISTFSDRQRTEVSQVQQYFFGERVTTHRREEHVVDDDGGWNETEEEREGMKNGE
jgi:hypothetical protein